MKKLLTSLLATVAAIAFLGFPGAPASGGTIDTSVLQKAFQKASSVDKAEVQKVLSAINSHDYRGAMSSLGKLASSENLTSDQKNAVQDTLGQLKTEQLKGIENSLGGGDSTNK